MNIIAVRLVVCFLNSAYEKRGQEISRKKGRAPPRLDLLGFSQKDSSMCRVVSTRANGVEASCRCAGGSFS